MVHISWLRLRKLSGGQSWSLLLHAIISSLMVKVVFKLYAWTNVTKYICPT